ncbi:MAG: histidine kinase [Verrucomicrobiae bacterium]|nr:histidine kinase [Verrucomicrobiae bacterium]
MDNFLITNRWKLYALIVGLWAAMVLLITSLIHLTGMFAWLEALKVAMCDVGPWLIFAPIVVWLCQRFPVEKPWLGRRLAMHAVCCIVMVALAPMLGMGWAPLPLHGGGGPRGAGGRQHDDGRPPPPSKSQMEMPPPFFQEGHGSEGRPGGPPPPPEPRFDQHSGGRFGPEPPGFLDFLIRMLMFRAHFNVPFYWMLVGMSHAVNYYRRSKERERRAMELEKHLMEARIRALQLQLQPHFLFNTLNAIAALVHKDADKADEMITNLSELLRVSLRNSTRQEVSLQEELALVDLYLEIQQVRFGERLRVVKGVEKEVLDAGVPNLILQPLVENAIKHGIEPKTGGGILTISARREKDRLLLCIGDDGENRQGLGSAANPVKEGIGLSNTFARLRELYGDDYRLELKREITGATLILEIPFHRMPCASTNLKTS